MDVEKEVIDLKSTLRSMNEKLAEDSGNEPFKQSGTKYDSISNDDEFVNLQKDVMDLKKELNNIKKNMSNKGLRNGENISEDELLRKQIDQLKNQVDFLSSVVLKLQSDDKNGGSERGIESDIHQRHKNKFQTKLRLQNIDDQKGKKMTMRLYNS